MREVLQSFHRWFGICSAMAVFYTPIAFMSLRRRPHWLRFLDKEERFLTRLGLSKPATRLGRDFSKSRFFVLSMAYLVVVLLLVALAYFIFATR
jgi:hypothetical protein